MKANELRIGNLIQSRGNCVFEVTAEDLQFIEAGSLCKPIPLTEEWILKLGFDQTIHENGDFFTNGDLFLKNLDINYTAVFGKQALYYEIKHVHELQNLYFALTCHELTITLTFPR